MGEGGVARLRSATENVEKSLHKMAEELYKANEAAGAEQAGAAGAGAVARAEASQVAAPAGKKPGDVIDAEYVDVDDKRPAQLNQSSPRMSIPRACLGASEPSLARQSRQNLGARRF